MIGQQLQLRKAEIERLSSPEQLDTAMRVTSPKSWVALLAIGFLLVLAVAWGIWGKLTEKVDGTGMLMVGENVRTVQASVAGKVRSIEVAVGDRIGPGDPVAVLDRHDPDAEIRLRAEIGTSENRIEDLEAEQRRFKSRMARVRSSYQVQLDGLRAQLAKKKDLLARKLATTQDVLAIEGQIAQIQAQIAQTETGEGSFQVDINEERRKLEQLRGELAEDSVTVTSAVGGIVASILVNDDELIDAGSRILNLESTREEDDWQILLFVPFTEGKKVKPGMPVRVAPTTVKPEEYGYIRGEIVTVSSLPVNPEEVRATLNNDQLARKFAEDTPFRVRVRPILDEQGRFQWTSAKGETLEIDSNTPCSAQVITGERPPISYVIPKAKEILGLG